MVQLLHTNGQFTGLSHEDPTVHIQNFLKINDTYTPVGVNVDYTPRKCTGVSTTQSNKQSGSMSMEEMLKMIMADQAQLAADVRNNQLATQNLEKKFGQFASAQNSRPQGGLPGNTDPNPKQVNVVGTRIGLQLEELAPQKGNIDVVIMSSSQRPDKEVATSSHKKRAQSGNVPLAPAVPKGQTRRFGVKVVTKEGKAWYKKHTEASYFSDSMAQWTKHSRKRYHQSLPYAHMFRETCICLKIVMNCLIPGIHFTDITRDMVCLVYALMTGTELNIRAIVKSAMRKSRVHKGHMYDFSCLITKMCRAAGVPKEHLHYMAPLYPAPVDITRTKGTDTEFGPTLTTTERHRRDELITTMMYGLEMLHHQNGCHSSTDMQLGEVARRYPLNDHAKVLFGIDPAFREPVDSDISTNEKHARTSSDVDFDSEEEIDPAQASDEAEGGDAMED
uniref:Putative plant transposon protein domain-containing protein n=1 Tax=Solanum tuberosum TaxID=4113 RepID=M1D8H2_SOLTU